MAGKTCATCGQPRAQCACPPPPLPDTTGRVVQLHADRARVCRWLGGQAQQHLPEVRAWVDAEIARARTADEATIQAMLTQYDLPTRRRTGTGRYPTQALFYAHVVPLIHAYQQQAVHPSAEKVAAALPAPLSERQLRRVVEQLFDCTWEKFLHTFL